MINNILHGYIRSYIPALIIMALTIITILTLLSTDITPVANHQIETSFLGPQVDYSSIDQQILHIYEHEE